MVVLVDKGRLSPGVAYLVGGGRLSSGVADLVAGAWLFPGVADLVVGGWWPSVRLVVSPWVVFLRICSRRVQSLCISNFLFLR